MDLRYYLQILSRRKWVIVATVLFTVALVAAGTAIISPIYQANTTLRVASASGGSLTYYDYMYIDRLMNTNVELAASGPVLSELMERLDLKQLPDIGAEAIPNTELIKITVEDTNPQVAAVTANAMADILIEQSGQLYAGGEKSPQELLKAQLSLAQSEMEVAQHAYEELLQKSSADAQEIAAANQLLEFKQRTYANLLDQYDQARVREAMRANMLSVVEPAVVPHSPIKPDMLMNIALGLFVGLFGGLGLASVFENLDTTLYTADEIEAVTAINTLAKIPTAKAGQVDISQNGHTPQADAFRNLRTNIQRSNYQQKLKVLLVTSAEPKQGKSMIVSNLACSLAESGKKVVLIDSDLRLPELHKILDLPNQKGLADVLQAKASLDEVEQTGAHENLTVITSGSTPADPPQLLSSDGVSALIDSLSQDVDFILFDTPALLSFADAIALAPNADGFLLIVRQAHSSRDGVLAASKMLADFPDKYIRVVINDSERNTGYDRYYKKAYAA